jgi:hypothetical protein
MPFYKRNMSCANHDLVTQAKWLLRMVSRHVELMQVDAAWEGAKIRKSGAFAQCFMMLKQFVLLDGVLTSSKYFQIRTVRVPPKRRILQCVLRAAAEF